MPQATAPEHHDRKEKAKQNQLELLLVIHSID
jgi:hypothetical protein